MRNRPLLALFVILNVLWADYSVPHISSFKSNLNHNRDLNNIVAIMVDFQTDEDPETSGDGTFLQTVDVDFIHYQDIERCNDTSEFLLDKPPHNNIYFELQLEALKNYYYSVSNGHYNFDYQVLPNIYHLTNNMRYYATSDEKIGLLFSDAIELAKDDIQILNLNYENTLFVVFHAGLGQEASQDFDPTIYDIKSAYVDNEMLTSVPSEYWINDNLFNSSGIFFGGIVMPETLNWIYYDVIEDIFPLDFVGYSDLENYYCDFQIGMTGLFSYLMGYHFGFHPMYNIDNGVTGVGKFGLMDVGFYNWNGIIPSRPVPWTRMNSEINTETIDLTDDILQSTNYQNFIIQTISDGNDKIYKFKISDNEYFLLEKRSNILMNNKSIECIIDFYRDYGSHCALSDEIETVTDYIESNDDYKNIFDLIKSPQYGSFFEYDTEYNVITKIDNYDYGLPGSGILIWHINESNLDESNTLTIGVNGDDDNRVVKLEEADGVQNLGNPNFLIFSDISKGWRYDFWSRWIEGTSNEHRYYLDINYGQNNWPINYEINFGNITTPNSQTDSGINSNLSIKINNQNNIECKLISDNLFETVFVDEDIKVIGNDGQGCIYYKKADSLKSYCDDNSYTLIEENGITNLSYISYNGSITVINDFDNYISSNSENLVPVGYYGNSFLENVDGSVALGDIDGDGFDEKILINNGNLEVYSFTNNSDVLKSGFPVYGEFTGFPLVSDILNNDGTPEIIVKNHDYISFISNNGEIIYNIPLFNNDAELFIIPEWGDANSKVLANGDFLYIFDCTLSNCSNETNFWLNPFSTPELSSVVGGIHEILTQETTDKGIDISRIYNYPNPIKDGVTKFRFFVYDSQAVTIRIYDTSGYLIETLFSENLSLNTYNEIVWSFNSISPGLYLAEIKSDKNERKLIKVVVL